MLTSHADLSDGKISQKDIWNPQESVVELLPNDIILGRGKPSVMEVAHWHAQVEVNYVTSGWLRYEMCGDEFVVNDGNVALFWGGLPHRLADYGPDTHMEAIHLPLTQFFRLRLPDELRDKLMQGAALIATEKNDEDGHAFERWCEYFRSGDPARMDHAAQELLLRIERIAFGSYLFHEIAEPGESGSEVPDRKSVEKIRQIVDYITTHFREEIDAAAIADSAKLHPKYAMSIFKRSTGTTLNQYVQLLRLSYAQALLMRDDGNILDIAMDSGFGSLSHFNRTFRKQTGLSPSEYRAQVRDTSTAEWVLDR